MKMVFAFIVACCIAGCNRHTSEFKGVEWQPQDSGVTVSLRGVYAVDARVAWACGSGGTFLRTADGGVTWRAGNVPGAGDLEFRDIYAADVSTAVLLSAGRPAKIYKTVDGGETWSETYSNDTPGVFFNSMAFWDDRRGIACGDPLKGAFTLITTEDGAESWSTVPGEHIPAPIAGEAQFAASGTCIAVLGDLYAWFATGGSVARVFRSLDGGATWNVVTTPMLCGAASSGIFSIVFRDALNGVIVGGDFREEELAEKNAAVSPDGGMTWSLIEHSAPAGYRSCVRYVPGTATAPLITVGPSGSDYSVDDGLSWAPLDSVGYHSLSFARAAPVGWAVGSGGRIAKVVVHFE